MFSTSNDSSGIVFRGLTKINEERNTKPQRINITNQCLNKFNMHSICRRHGVGLFLKSVSFMLLNNPPRHEHRIQFNNALFKVYTEVDVLIGEEFVEYRRMFNKIQINSHSACNSQFTAFVNCNFSILIHRKSSENVQF